MSDTIAPVTEIHSISHLKLSLDVFSKLDDDPMSKMAFSKETICDGWRWQSEAIWQLLRAFREDLDHSPEELIELLDEAKNRLEKLAES